MPGPKTQAQRAINAPHVPGGTAPPIRQPAHTSAGPTQPREKMAGRPRLTTLIARDKPAGSAGRGQSDNAGEEQPSKKKRAGYNLQETLSLSEKQYKIAWAVVKIMCGKYLDTTKSFEAQNGGAVLDCITHIRFELDEFEAFKDPLWPIRDFMVMILKSSANSWAMLCREAKAESNNAGSGGETNNQGGNNNDSGALDAGTASVPAPSNPTPPSAATPTLAPASAPAQPSTLAPGSAAPPASGTAPTSQPTSQPTSRPRPKQKQKAPATGKHKRTDGPENEPEPAPEPQPDDEPQPETQPGEPGAQPDEAESQTGEPAPDSQSEAEANAPPPQDAPASPTPPPAAKGKGKAKDKAQSGPVQLTKEPIPDRPPTKRQKRSDPIPDEDLESSEDSESSEDEATTSAGKTKGVSGRTRAATKQANGNAATTKAAAKKAAATKAATTKAATGKAKAATTKNATTRRKK
ncbi:hypothetical protein FRC08_016394 [Ceratobasidium sp. 394]|nr:hypothetical protein FRC08_016394 [Ceratobasidium sp. 394]